MAAAILTQGLTKIRDALKTKVTHVGVSTDTTAFAVGQTDLSPDVGATDLIKATSAETDVDAQTVDFEMTINGDSEFTNNTIWTIGILDGSASSNAISRTVRTQGIGVQAGDSFTIAVRAKIEDNS